MARKRPTASDVSQGPLPLDAARAVGTGRNGADALTQAQASALRRCAPLNTSEFKAQRQVIAQQHRFSVLRILRHGAGDDSIAAPRQAPRGGSDATAPAGERRKSRLVRRHD